MLLFYSIGLFGGGCWLCLLFLLHCLAMCLMVVVRLFGLLSAHPDLPYYVARTRHRTFPTYLERRRDKINPDDYQIDYVELVVLKNVEGDVFVSFLLTLFEFSVHALNNMNENRRAFFKEFFFDFKNML